MIALCTLMLITTIIAATSNRFDVLNLPMMVGWEKKSFSGETSYQIVDIDNNRQAIKAISESSASGLVKEVEIDLKQTPYMNWSWKVDAVRSHVQETQKSGDDYAARVYVVIVDGFFSWKKRAISYVWSSHQPKGHVWPNAFSSSTTMVAVQSGNGFTGEWVEEKRNILQDIKQLIGSDVTIVKAVAIMTDTDNSRQSATAYYGDIYFTAE